MEESKSNFQEKLTKFVKDNVITGVIILICIVYICFGIVTVKHKDGDIQSVIAGSLINLCVGLSIKILMRKKGIKAGLNDSRFIKTSELYGNKLDKNTSNITLLDDYCEYRNDKKLKIKQTRYLRKYGLSYDKFINNEYDPNDKIIKKCRNIRCYQLSSIVMLNAINIIENEEEVLNKNINRYETKSFISNFIIGLGIAILFAYYGIEEGSINVMGMLWASLQTGINLIFGTIEYFNGNSFVTSDLRSKLIYIISCFDEFETLNNEGYFKKGVNDGIKQNEQSIQPTNTTESSEHSCC